MGVGDSVISYVLIFPPASHLENPIRVFPVLIRPQPGAQRPNRYWPQGSGGSEESHLTRRHVPGHGVGRSDDAGLAGGNGRPTDRRRVLGCLRPLASSAARGDGENITSCRCCYLSFPASPLEEVLYCTRQKHHEDRSYHSATIQVSLMASSAKTRLQICHSSLF